MNDERIQMYMDDLEEHFNRNVRGRQPSKEEERKQINDEFLSWLGNIGKLFFFMVCIGIPLSFFVGIPVALGGLLLILLLGFVIYSND